MDKAVADVSLRLWTPQGATVKFVKQVEPTLADLTARRTELPPRSGDYPTGSWGSETRDYHVCVQVPAAATGEKMLAGRVSLVVPGAAAKRSRCSARAGSWRCGPTTPRCRRGSTARSRTTPARRSWRRHPGGPGGTQGRRRRDGDREAGPRGAAGDGDRPLRHREAAGEGGRRRGRADRHRAAEAQGGDGRRDDPGHPVVQDDAGAQEAADGQRRPDGDLPTGPHVGGRGVLRRLRPGDRRRPGSGVRRRPRGRRAGTAAGRRRRARRAARRWPAGSARRAATTPWRPCRPRPLAGRAGGRGRATGPGGPHAGGGDVDGDGNRGPGVLRLGDGGRRPGRGRHQRSRRTARTGTSRCRASRSASAGRAAAGASTRTSTCSARRRTPACPTCTRCCWHRTTAAGPLWTWTRRTAQS